MVTTDHPGCRDAIEADVTGLLVPVRDAVALADAIERLLKDPRGALKWVKQVGYWLKLHLMKNR